MSAPQPSRPVLGVQADDVQALLKNLAQSVPKTQFMREIPFNSIQACERAMAAGAPRGLVVVDYVDSPAGARKLRIWDTGDGMTRQDLHDRLVCLSTNARTSENFGVGAKLCLTRVAPHGVLYTTLRDGQAFTARWHLDGATGAWGLAVLDPDGIDAVSQSVQPCNIADLPAELQAAGHGTAVVILGQSADDPTAWSLRPEGSQSKRWALETLNDRFTTFPDGIELRVVMPNVEKDGHGGFRDDVRIARGSAGNLKYYTREHKGSSDPVNGARGKVRIAGPVPATAYWWVLPAVTSPPSYMRVGGKVRVVVDGEAYETHGSKYMSTAGVWTQIPKVEIHFVPDEARPDLQRSTVTTNGGAVPLLEWCEEFKRVMPAAIKNLLSNSPKAPAAGDYTAKFTELFGRLSSAPVGRRRSTRSTCGGTPTGEVVQLAAAHAGGVKRRGGSGSGRRSLRSLFTGRRPNAAVTGELTSGAVLSMDEPRGAGRRVARVNVTPPVPLCVWVNITDLSDDPELGDFAARYVVGENLLVMNGQGSTYRKLLGSYLHQYRGVPGSRERVEAHVRTSSQLLLVDSVMGAQRDFPASWQEMLTPAGLSVNACGVYHSDNGLKRVFGRLFKTGPVVEEELIFDELVA